MAGAGYIYALENQLDMFGQDAAVTAKPERVDLVTRVRLLMGSAEFENFAWWCKNGNRVMCEAVLLKRGILSIDDARVVASQIGGQA